jgi:hypothetical protein
LDTVISGAKFVMAREKKISPFKKSVHRVDVQVEYTKLKLIRDNNISLSEEKNKQMIETMKIMHERLKPFFLYKLLVNQKIIF